jgi:methyltransferase, FkbM family
MKYGARLDEFWLGKWGRIQFYQWLNPNERGQNFTQGTIDWLANFINAGDTVIDIGAYTGDTAIPMAVAAGKTGTVHAFEPNPAALEVLMQNATLNPDIASIIVYPYAIGTTRGDAVFRYHAEQINGGFLTEGAPVPVKRVRLDECDITGRISFVKFDTEGEDGVLLAEFNNWLSLRKPVVQVERFPHLNECQVKQLWKAIDTYGIPSMEGDWNFSRLMSLPDVLCNIMVRPYVGVCV